MPPARDDSEADARKVLSPDELDIENNDNVTALDDGRFVIGSDGEPSVSDDASSVPNEPSDAAPKSNAPSAEPPTTDSSSADDVASSADAIPSDDAMSTSDAASTPGSASESPDSPRRSDPPGTDQPADAGIDARDVRRWLEEDLSDVGSRYGFHVAAKSEDRVSHQQMFSDDVGTVFDGLLLWYAQQVDRDTPVEDVLGILMMESNLRVRYSPRCLHGVLDAHDLSPDDSIADLFEAMRDANGLVFPPESAGRSDR